MEGKTIDVHDPSHTLYITHEELPRCEQDRLAIGTANLRLPGLRAGLGEGSGLAQMTKAPPPN